MVFLGQKIVMLLIVTAVVSVQSGLPQQRLLVVGGGDRPKDAIEKFVGWSGGERARLLVITWASGVPVESFAALKKDLSIRPGVTVEQAAMPPLDAAQRRLFLDQLDRATGVFFSGGDQNRIMDVLADDELLRRLQARYAKGVPFGGTSAGAAVLSDPMITGVADLKKLDGRQVGVRKGLGLLPDVIFDQHFLIRQRHNRLFGLVMVRPRVLGIGIDEDTAVLVEDNRRVTVAGATFAMFVHSRKGGNPYLVDILRSGERFDLKKRRTMRG